MNNMLFIDLNKMKIIKDYQFKLVSREVDFDFENQPLRNKTETIVNLCQEMIQPSSLSVSYEIHILGEGTANELEIDDFLSVVNMISMVFFANMIEDKGRKREHRLDVPQKLLAVKTSRLTLKKAINQKTINDVFNLTIYYKDLIYKLCDEKELKGESDDN